MTSTMSRGGRAGTTQRKTTGNNRRVRMDPRQYTVRRPAWFMGKFLCRDFDEMNMHMMREHLSTCKGIKTEVKLTPERLSSGRRSIFHKMPRQAFPLAHVHSLEADEQFVNVLLVVMNLVGIPDIKYEVIAYKLTSVADVNALVAKWQEWTGCVPVTRSVNGSILGGLARSSSLHTLSMPGRPTPNGTLASDRWVMVNQGPERRYTTGSVADLSITDGYYRRPTPASASALGGVRRTNYSSSGVDPIGYRGRATPAGDHPWSDEGNGSLSSEHVTYREVATSVRGPTDPNSQSTMHFQRMRPYTLNARSGPIADVGCQVNLPGTDGGPRIANGLTGVVDFDDEGSTLSDVSSSLLEDSRGASISVNGYGNGVAVAHVNGSRGRMMSYDELDSRQQQQHQQRVDMTTDVGRVYNRTTSDQQRPARYVSDSASFTQIPAMTRARSVEPLNGRYVSNSSRSDIYRSQDRLDAVSVRSTQSNTILVHPKFQKQYAPRPAPNTLQVPGVSYYASGGGSNYGGQRGRYN